jgi:hypothetical protein
MTRAVGWDKRWVFFAEQCLAGPVPATIPRLSEFQDAAWSPPDREQLIRYLESATEMLTGGPDVRCPLCRQNLGNVLRWRSDGVWTWRNDLSHYVRDHFVRLPDAMVEHIRLRQYQLPLPSQVDWKALSMPA